VDATFPGTGRRAGATGVDPDLIRRSAGSVRLLRERAQHSFLPGAIRGQLGR
jgi:hypothetical protein